jgi:hypothetical protein
MIVRSARIVSIAIASVLSLVSVCAAQSIHWGAKAGVNSTSVNDVTDYYDWVLCCHPRFPDATVGASSGAGVTAGGFVALPIHGWLGLQGEVGFSRKRHSVDLQPYEAIEATFTRDYVEVAGLAKVEFPVTAQNHLYVAGGPVFGFRIAEEAESSDPRLTRGDPETDIYVVQLLAYAAPELLRTSQTSLAIGAGWVYRQLLVEVRFTQGLQSIFKDREGLVAGFVEAGGDETTLRRLIGEFGPFLESARSRDVAVLAGFRF